MVALVGVLSRSSTPPVIGMSASAADVRAVAEGAGFVCDPPDGNNPFPFPTVECRRMNPPNGRDYVRIYGRPDGSVAGVEGLATLEIEGPGDPPAVIDVLEPVLRASVDSATADHVLDLVRAHLDGAATPIPVDPSLQVRIFRIGPGNENVAVLALDLASIWGHPPKP